MLVGAQLNFNFYNNQGSFSIYYYKISGYITKELIDKYNELYQLNKENKLKNNTVINLTSLSNFPSYKLKNYIEENNLNITTARKLDKLDYLIINHELIKTSYLDKPLKPYYIIPSEVILKNPLFSKYIKKEGYNKIDILRNEYITHYFIPKEKYKDLLQFDNNFSIIENYPLINCSLIENSWGDKKMCDSFDYFMNLYELVNKYNLKIIFDSNISNEINQGLSIDEDVFENILNMLSSDDESNLEIAKEILANMEYEPSKPYLIYLFNYFYKLKTNRSNNKNYNYLRKQINKNIYLNFTQSYSATFNEFIPTLINKHPEYTQIFMNCFRIHMNLLIKINIIKEITTH